MDVTGNDNMEMFGNARGVLTFHFTGILKILNEPNWDH